MNRFPRALAFLTVASAFALGTAAVAQPGSASTLEAGVDSLMAAYDRPDSPGAAVLVFKGDETIFVRGYGMANLEYDIPITPSTVFHVASVSKQFTAFAVAMLAAEGRLALDDDVRTHLPELPDLGSPITLRQLLHHTSGLRDQWNLWVLSGGRMDDVIRQDDLFQLVSRQRELNFAPGAEHLYSNSGYMLAARVVERVTGEPFGDWLRTNVLAPLGMTSTQVYDDHERIVPGRAYSYRGDEAGFRKAVLSYGNSGATSLFTTAEDLALWLRNYGHARVGGPEVREMMLTRGLLTTGDTISYALGVMLDEFRGLEMIQHGGADAGFRSYAAYFPALDAGVVVLSNLGSFNPGGMTRRVAEVFFERHLIPTEPTSGEVALSVALLDRLVGDWHLEGGGMEVRIERQGRSLFAIVPEMGRLEMIAVADSVFHIPAIGGEITFHRAESEEVSMASVLVPPAESMTLRRVERRVPSAEELRAFTGRYYSPELETLYTLVVEDDGLVARHRRHGDIMLAHDNGDRFTGNQWFFGDVTFDRAENGEITHMRVSSGRVRNLAFERLE